MVILPRTKWERLDTCIGKGCVVACNISCKGTLLLMGDVQGEVRANLIVLASDHAGKLLHNVRRSKQFHSQLPYVCIPIAHVSVIQKNRWFRSHPRYDYAQVTQKTTVSLWENTKKTLRSFGERNPIPPHHPQHEKGAHESMFKKWKTNIHTTDTIIGEGTVVDGNLVTHASIRIDGKIIGDISCAGDVTIGENGSVRSITTARNVLNAGTIDGSVHVLGKLAITSKGRVRGEIIATSLHISEGGLFNGKCVMTVSDGGTVEEVNMPKNNRFVAGTN